MRGAHGLNGVGGRRGAGAGRDTPGYRDGGGRDEGRAFPGAKEGLRKKKKKLTFLKEGP